MTDPQPPDGPVVPLVIPESTLAAIDAARGDMPREAWILRAVAMGLVQFMAELAAAKAAQN
jgi:hypothetical protein